MIGLLAFFYLLSGAFFGGEYFQKYQDRVPLFNLLAESLIVVIFWPLYLFCVKIRHDS